MEKLKGKVAVITGGSSGMALASAKRSVEEGAYVFITGRRQEQLDEAVKLIGRNVTGVRGDTDLASVLLGDCQRFDKTIRSGGFLPSLDLHQSGVSPEGLPWKHGTSRAYLGRLLSKRNCYGFAASDRPNRLEIAVFGNRGTT
jgi:hypothetical protein